MEAQIRVLHVEDDVEFASMTAAYLEQEGFEVETVHDANDALGFVVGVDCVVADYEMPGIDGVEFLRQVRERDPDIPFIVFTGRGSEEVAAEAISAGVTDYLQKRGTGQYTLLANRIRNYVTKRRAEDERFRGYQAIERAAEGISLLDEEGRFIYVNEAFTRLVGYDRTELVGGGWERLYRDEDVARIRDDLLPAAADGGWTGELFYQRKDGETVLTSHSLSMTDGGQLICIAQDISDEARRRRELLEAKRFELLVNAVTEYAIVMLDTDGQVVTWNDGAARIFGYDESAVVGEHLSLFVPDDDAVSGTLEERLAAARTDGSTAYEGWRVRSDGSQFWANVVLTAVFDEGGDHIGYAKVIRDQTERREREQELERQRQALAAATRTNAIHGDVTRRIVDGASRADIAADVCERLAARGQYTVALAGQYEADGSLSVEAAAGIDADAGAYLFEHTADADVVERAWERGEVQVQHVDATDVTLDHELADVIEAIVYVPLGHRGTVYGLVCLYADRRESTTSSVLRALTDVGSAAGYGIHTLETERLLQADGVVELTFRTTEGEEFMRMLTEDGGDAQLERLVPIDPDRFLLYVSYADRAVADVAGAAEATPCVEEWDVVYHHEDGSGLVSVTEVGSLVSRLVDVGAKVHTAESRGGGLDVVVDVSPSADVSRIVETLRTSEPGVRMVSKRRVARPVKRTRAVANAIEEKLTERQLTALQTAYHGGYFDRPRKQTAEEVAERMGISASTFHQHLRIALDTVLRELFDASDHESD